MIQKFKKKEKNGYRFGISTVMVQQLLYCKRMKNLGTKDLGISKLMENHTKINLISRKKMDVHQQRLLSDYLNPKIILELKAIWYVPTKII